MVWLIALPFGQASPRSTVLLTGPDVADHSGDGLASVLRFKVKIQFLSPA